MCKVYKILYAILPLKKWRSVLIRGHFERCPSCSAEMDGLNKGAGVFFRPGWIQETRNLWPRVRRGIFSFENRPEEFCPDIHAARFRVKKWRLAAAFSALFVLGVIGFFFLGHHERNVLAPELVPLQAPAAMAPRIQVISVELKGKRAKAYIYQTPTASFIWIAPAKDIGG